MSVSLRHVYIIFFLAILLAFTIHTHTDSQGIWSVITSGFNF